MVNSRQGRPAGPPRARGLLLDAARRHLEAGDLDVVSSRTLADEVGVSHTLVNYYFGSREALCAAAASLLVNPGDVIARSRDARGRIDPSRLVRGIVVAWEHPESGPRLVAFARRLAASGDPALAGYVQHAIVDALSEEFGRERAHRAVVTIAGFVFTRYVLCVPSVAGLSHAEAARLLESALR